MGVIRKILYVLGVNVDAPKSKTIKLTLIDLNNKIGELNKIEI
jgi:hypothetical protein